MRRSLRCSWHLLTLLCLFWLQGHLRSPRLTKPCKVLAVAKLYIPGEGLDLDQDEFECELDAADANGISGMSYPIQMDTAQAEVLSAKYDSGELLPGESFLNLPGAAFENGAGRGKVVLPPGQEIKLHTPARRRKLAIVTGDKPILAVRVTDINGLVYPHSPATMSDNIFGTYGDPNNLASQLNDCSMNKLTVVTEYSDSTVADKLSDVGLLDVTINLDLTTALDRYQVRNAITAAVQTKLGFNLPGPFQQVMYITQKCYVDCGWAAYAYLNSWNSVYQDRYYYMTGVQVSKARIANC